MSSASQEVRGSIDYNQFELRNAILQNLIVSPVGSVNGQLYYSSSKNIAFYKHPDEWRPFGIPPVHVKYADSIAMINDQTKQFKGYIYYTEDNDTYYEYLGTTLGNISDYNPIGGGNLNKIFYKRDVFTYTNINVFTLSKLPLSGLEVYINGQKKRFGVDYTVSDTTLTINTTNVLLDQYIPIAEIEAVYFYSTVPISNEVGDSPSEIVLKLQSLTGDDRLDATAIKNLPTVSSGGFITRNYLGDVWVHNGLFHSVSTSAIRSTELKFTPVLPSLNLNSGAKLIGVRFRVTATPSGTPSLRLGFWSLEENGELALVQDLGIVNPNSIGVITINCDVFFDVGKMHYITMGIDGDAGQTVQVQGYSGNPSGAWGATSNNFDSAGQGLEKSVAYTGVLPNTETLPITSATVNGASNIPLIHYLILG
jgi:hypothetical protein